jgi:hypothetical protein
MKPALLLSLLLTGCATTETTRTLPDGSVERRTERGLTDRAAGIGIRVGDRVLDRYLGPDGEKESSK